MRGAFNFAANDFLPMRLILTAALALLSSVATAQLQPTEPDNSPMDISYSPYAYPLLRFQSKTAPATPNARVVYSRPQCKGRQLFGAEIKYNDIWRLGANESTELELYKSATIGGKKLAKGRYTLFCIPQANTWTIVVNKDLNTWGAFNYNAANDLLRVNVPVQRNQPPVEFLTIFFDAGNNLQVMWADLKVQVPFVFAAK
jgi:hypothetical protein